MPNKKNRDKEKKKDIRQPQQRQPTTEESLVYSINQLSNHSTVVKIGLNEMEKARVSLITFIKKMSIENKQTIDALMQTIAKTSKCPHCGKSTSAKPTKTKSKTKKKTTS